MLFSSAALVGGDEGLAPSRATSCRAGLGIHRKALALRTRVARKGPCRPDVDVVAVADLHRVHAHAFLLREVRRVLGRDDAFVRVAVGQQDDGLAARVAAPHARHRGAHRVADGGLAAVDDVELDLGDERRDERVVERRRRKDERLLGEDDDADAVGLAASDEVDEHVLGDVDARRAVARSAAAGAGDRSLCGASMTAAIEPDRSSTMTISMPSLFLRLALEDALGTTEGQRAPERARHLGGLPANRAAEVAPATRAEREPGKRWSGAPRRGTLASAPRVLRYTMYGTAQKRATSAAHQPARASHESESAVEGCEPSGPGHVVHWAERHASPRASTGPTSATARMARVPSATRTPRNPAGACSRSYRRGVDCAGADVGGIVARTNSFGFPQCSLALVEGRRDVGELHEIAVLQEGRDFGEGHPKVGNLAQRGQHLVGRRLQPVEAEARAQAFAHRVVHAVEELGKRFGLEQPGVAYLVETFERHFPRRARRRRRRRRPRPLDPSIDQPSEGAPDHRANRLPNRARVRDRPTPRAARAAAGWASAGRPVSKKSGLRPRWCAAWCRG